MYNKDFLRQVLAEDKDLLELKNVKFTMYGMGCMSHAIVVAAQAVGEGRTHTCLVLKSWHNLEGR